MHSPTALLSLRLKEKTLHHLRTHIHFNQVHTLPLKPPGVNIVVSEKKDGGKNKTVLVAVDGIHFTILKPGGSWGEVAAALHAGELLEKVLGVPSELRSRTSYNSTFDLLSVFVGIQELSSRRSWPGWCGPWHSAPLGQIVWTSCG